MSATFKVRALAQGEHALILFYPGDVFKLFPREVETQEWDASGNRLGPPVVRTLTAEEQFAPSWMVRVSDDTPEHTTTAQEALKREEAELSASPY